ncbi:10493_t:CDS:2 [Dentiscutata heterogama]|uniref:10493_t:CDS:1 n=1 Tax=Dentiscutata heterogama TaxID=1316150 RepID=A0ACA9LAC1_9GLOM|nr:10493_t:CDS:2 [Dentiscutata heterogama]
MKEFESFANPVTRSNSPDSETRSTSAKSDNETPNMPTIKKTKVGRRVNIEVTYAICQVLNDSDKEHCNIQLKTSSGSTSNLITHLLSAYGITQNGPGLSGPDSDNSKSTQTKIDSFIKNTYPHSKSKNNKLTMTLIKFIICDAQPISLVSSQFFCEFVKELDPMFNIPNEKSHKIKNALYSVLLHYWDLSDGDAFLVCLLDPRCKKLMLATPTQRHQAETALRNKYNEIKSLYKASTSSNKSFSPREDQDKQEGQRQIYQKTFFKTVFMQNTSEELNDELDNYLSLPEIYYKSDPFNSL